MTPFAKAKANRGWAAVAALGLSTVAGLEAFALYQGINGSALMSSVD